MSLQAEANGPLRLASPPRAVAATAAAAGHQDWRCWRRTYIQVLVGLDAIAMIAGGLVGLQQRFGTTHVVTGGLSYAWIVASMVLGWVALMGLSRCYEARVLGVGSDEFKRVFNAAVRCTALVAVVAYALKYGLARGFVVIALPIATLSSLLLRYVARQVLHRLRAAGVGNQRVLVIGSGEPAAQLISTLRRTSYAGLKVVGVCMPGGSREDSPGDIGVPVVGSLASFPEAMRRVDADTVVVAHSPGINTAALQSIAWELEGTGVDLIVAPALTNVAGPRIAVRPVAGLPLLHIDEPELSGVNRAVKAVVDRLGALVLIAVLSPVMLLAAIAIKLTSRGPLLFTQTRVGRDGAEFLVLKFRSMRVGADQEHQALAASHDRDGHVLFKMRNDPRVTLVGRVLRRWSLDELPQLFNVVTGHMSLVGPRPPLPSEVAIYERQAHRRLKVRPGLTGLWQVSGRADLPWDETVRLDLYYVENWSLALDFMILWKTAWAVIGGAGAY